MDSDLYMTLVNYEATKSIDPTRGVGALLLSESGKVVSTGYNTFPKWVDVNNINNISKVEKGVLATHAEVQCLNNIDYDVLDINEAHTLYISCSPCLHCTYAIVNSKLNITRVVYQYEQLSDDFKNRYKIEEAILYLVENNVEVDNLCHIH